MSVIFGAILVTLVSISTLWFVGMAWEYNMKMRWVTIVGVSAIVLGVGLIYGTVILNKSSCNVEVVEKVEIFAGYNDSSMNGRFFLGSGSVDEKDVVYYWANNNGVKTKHSQPMDKSVFIEDGGGYVLLKSQTCKEGWDWFFLCDGFYQAEFHVPEGSIVQMYQYR